jgi:large subunit ribosomal protein L36
MIPRGRSGGDAPGVSSTGGRTLAAAVLLRNFYRTKTVVVLGAPGEAEVGSAEGRYAMKARNSLRSLKQKTGSVVVRRGRKVLVVNKRNPRWNARQG